jgi:hypothetical protein
LICYFEEPRGRWRVERSCCRAVTDFSKPVRHPTYSDAKPGKKLVY